MNNQLLFDGYLRDDLNKEEQEQLLSLIESDTTVRSQFIEHIHFSSLQVSVSLNLETGKSRTKRLKPQGNNKLVLWSTVLVAALVCLGVFISWSHQKPKISFELTSFKSNNSLLKGELLPQVTTFILEGEQRVYRDSRDNKVVISGPANFRAVSDQKLILNSGKVSVFLDDSTNGFMVETPQTLVEDLGTAFGCFVDGETTEIHVFDGVVQFGVERHKLSARNAVAVERQKWEEIPYDRTLFSINSQLVPELQKVNLKVGEILYLSTKGVNEIKGSVNFKKLNHDRPRFEVLYGAEMVNAERFREDQNPMPFSFGIMSNSIGLRLNGRGNDYVTSELVVTLDEYPYMLPQELISAESTWSYLKPGKSMAADWHSDAAEIRNWQQGKGGIGFGRKVNTLLEEDDAPLYLSKSFDADEVPENSQLLLSSILDDGGIIYLNGHEIYRNNYDGAGLSPDARSHTRRGTEREHFYETVRLPSDKLKIGKNIISVVLCQYEKRSGDMYFDLILKLANQIE